MLLTASYFLPKSIVFCGEKSPRSGKYRCFFSIAIKAKVGVL